MLHRASASRLHGHPYRHCRPLFRSFSTPRRDVPSGTTDQCVCTPGAQTRPDTSTAYEAPASLRVRLLNTCCQSELASDDASVVHTATTTRIGSLAPLRNLSKGGAAETRWAERARRTPDIAGAPSFCSYPSQLTGMNRNARSMQRGMRACARGPGTKLFATPGDPGEAGAMCPGSPRGWDVLSLGFRHTKTTRPSTASRRT